MRRLALSVALAAVVAACAGPRTHELVGSCWQDDPSSRWVVENELHSRADSTCGPGGWTMIDRREETEQGGHIYRWTIACGG